MAPAVQVVLEADTTWTIHRDGAVSLAMHVIRDQTLQFLPRFGLRLFMPKAMGRVVYCGYGPNESDVDKHRSSCCPSPKRS